jgi:hypothetical protein
MKALDSCHSQSLSEGCMPLTRYACQAAAAVAAAETALKE